MATSTVSNMCLYVLHQGGPDTKSRCPFPKPTQSKCSSHKKTSWLMRNPNSLGAIYRSTSAPQGAAGSASDVFNPTKRAVTARSMQRTLKRYNISYAPPPQHPRKTVNALRLLHYLTGQERVELSKRLFQAYWVQGRDVSNDEVLLAIAQEAGVQSVDQRAFTDATARAELEKATADAIERGAFGVPGFYIPSATWTDFSGETRTGRFLWGQDRMHFVEATLRAMRCQGDWANVEGLKGLVPRCVPRNEVKGRVKVEFWYDFSSPWAYLGWTQLERLERMFGEGLEVVKKPFLLGILFRELVSLSFPSLFKPPFFFLCR
jgi:2-hydroxychromene-2-carboxylate isomerase